MNHIKCLIISLGCFLSFMANGQTSQKISVKGSELPYFLAKNLYKYPSFLNAKVYFTNAEAAAGKLNYNFLLQDMQFVDAKGDTMVMADESNVKYVTIGTDSFFYDKGYYEWVATGPKLRLAARHLLKTSGESLPVGAYGTTSPNGGVQAQKDLKAFGSTVDLAPNELIDFTKENTYYLSTDWQHFYELNKKTVKKIFAKNADKVNDYIESNKINLNKEEDVITLFAFLNKLS